MLGPFSLFVLPHPLVGPRAFPPVQGLQRFGNPFGTGGSPANLRSHLFLLPAGGVEPLHVPVSKSESMHSAAEPLRHYDITNLLVVFPRRLLARHGFTAAENGV